MPSSIMGLAGVVGIFIGLAVLLAARGRGRFSGRIQYRTPSTC